MADEDEREHLWANWGRGESLAFWLVWMLVVATSFVGALGQGGRLGSSLVWTGVLGLPIGFCVGLFAILLLRAFKEHRVRNRVWDRTTKGWRDLEIKLFVPGAHDPIFREAIDELTIAGVRQDAFVGLQVVRQSEEWWVVHTTITADGKLNLERTRAGRWPGTHGRQSPPVEPLGEKPFDDLVELTGPRDRALALMDQDTRAATVSATRGCKVTIDFGSDTPILGFSLQRRCSEKEPWRAPNSPNLSLRNTRIFLVFMVILYL